MNLYYFNPNSYREEAFVCAESKEKAIEYLKLTITEKSSDYDKKKILNMTNPTIENEYSIDEYPVGKVVFTEIS